MKNAQGVEALHHDHASDGYKPSTLLFINNIIIFLLTVAGFIFFVSITGGGKAPHLYEGIKEFVATKPYYPMLIVFIPTIGGFISVSFGKNYENLRDGLTAMFTFITLMMVLAMYPAVASETLVLNLPRMLGYGLLFKVDMLSYIMATLTSILWLMAMIYAPHYMTVEKHRNRFYLCTAITYGAILGTVMSGDLFTTFLFFEIMTFSSYMLVVHCETEDAIAAGDSYIYMGVFGGLCILLGMILLYIHTNTLEFMPMISQLESMGNTRYIVMALFMVGFGVKAGMIPMHIWLPKAHPVAPTPASALLSGIMIKVGGYGMLRTATSFFFPAANEIESYKDALWLSSQNLGAVIIWMGIATMGIGVFMALQQGNMKKMLAYHSVSQMGYVIMGIGVAIYLGHKGAMGFTGGVFHMINHALFKSLLFMVAGAIYLQTHHLDMYKLGGLWRKMPFTFIVALIAALGITGTPLFNGFASKTILHHAIVEAYEYGHHSFRYAEILFTIISGGTVCSFIKLISYTFLGKCSEENEKIGNGYRMMDMAMMGMAILIIGIGIKPNYILDFLLIPAARGVTYDPYFIQNYIVDMNVFIAPDLLAMIPVYILGAVIFTLGKKFHLFHLHFPHWLRFDYILFYPVFKLTNFIIKRLSRGQEAMQKKEDGLVDGVNSAINAVTEKYESNVSKGERLVDDVSSAINYLTEEYESKLNKSEGLIGRCVYTLNLITNRYESSIIKSDVVIYAIILTTLLGTLLVFK
ncbi:Formate hydrogenlyase subunit 3/Multisubunit Na+/H+ antiporter, MnhD subunit [Natronincola peptidivorans]|uniref:Formate hydrogenlyase subunit 3/Multisubunit Na+/H+ antiporter, MnhD subunit n=1 Tax=Natronincola peptidivorans TaxID=426128 RepID=A0A1I0BIY1_9FIRM|nr:proton-conducting transporter membrane subunit [Natronincola peptidivorans]SET06585.1 Formate hydrogenlyase subunit 3/Multisubunit Na+/H+ antiporter, MnhD subunit [Natronincola peptidivorans]